MRKPVYRQHGLDNPADLLAFDAVSQVPVKKVMFYIEELIYRGHETNMAFSPL